MIYVGNAFSLQMVEGDCEISVRAIERPTDSVLADAVSCVGHADTASVVGVPFNRISVRLNKGDVLYVAQIVGGRLPEGTTTLPEGYKIAWREVVVK